MDAQRLAYALGGKKSGSAWAARCPAHDDREPSLSIAQSADKVLIFCHAGCSQERVINALRRTGLWCRSTSSVTGGSTSRTNKTAVTARSAAAATIWACGRRPTGTIVEEYLGSRGLNLPPDPVLRFHPGLHHPSGRFWPAMIALVTCGETGGAVAIHRTFLARGGLGKAPVQPAKMMLGPCRGGVVRLGVAENVVMVGEGIETCLAAMQATGTPAWAALSTMGLRTLELPKVVQEVIVLADGDAAGEAAARDAALRWRREGRRARIARPPAGLDFNDVLLGRFPALMDGAA